MEELFTSSRVTGLYFSHGNTLSGRGGEIDQSSDIFSSVLLVELFVGGFLGTRHICPVGDAEGGRACSGVEYTPAPAKANMDAPNTVLSDTSETLTGIRRMSALIWVQTLAPPPTRMRNRFEAAHGFQTAQAGFQPPGESLHGGAVDMAACSSQHQSVDGAFRSPEARKSGTIVTPSQPGGTAAASASMVS